jgi:hypothetical protein
MGQPKSGNQTISHQNVAGCQRFLIGSVTGMCLHRRPLGRGGVDARPSTSHADEAAGLTAVELALRLEHVTRVTEQLHLIDSGHVRRTVDLDLDLRVLTERQREALTVRTREPGKPVLWIPIARQNRDHLAPVTVVDRSGSVVPRITSEATVDAVIAGMARLLRIQVAARIAARADRETEKLISVRARWLIEHAMAYLIRHGHGTPPATAAPSDPANHDQPSVGGELAEVRRQAAAYFDELEVEAEYADDFDWLLNSAIKEQLLIVMIPATSKQEHLRYEAPPATSKHGDPNRPTSWRTGPSNGTNTVVAISSCPPCFPDSPGVSQDNLAAQTAPVTTSQWPWG